MGQGSDMEAFGVRQEQSRNGLRTAAIVETARRWALCACVGILVGCSEADPAAEASAAAAADAAASRAAEAPAAIGRVSRPGEYSGYGDARFDGYERTSQYVTVRDGTRLAVDVYRPTDGGVVVEEPLPVVWMHTPYNRRHYRGDRLTALAYPGEALKLAAYGYVVAVADFRGLYASFGTNGAYNRGEWLDAAWWDAYDITEWLAEQPFSNGNIGMWGCSATGGSQMQAMATAPPHLKAVFPMSCEFDVYAFAVPGGMSPPKGIPSRIPRGGSREERDRSAVPVDGENAEALLAAAVAEHGNNVETAGYVPFRDSVSDTLSERWWLKSSPHTYLDAINRSGIAVYAAANWDEGATKHGAAFTYNNVAAPAKLIFGPESHCNWIAVRESTGFDIVVEERRFFDHWLKGIDNGVMDEPAVTYYTYNAPPGEEWRTAERWPLPNEVRTDFYLGEASLGREAPERGAGDTVTVEYPSRDGASGAEPAAAPPALTYTTEPLTADLEVTGHPVVTLWLSSTATDADVMARLEDVAPDGSTRSHYMEGRLRASHRALAEPPYDHLGLPWHSYREADAQPLEPRQAVELSFDLWPISYVFAAGHRLRLTLSFADERATPRRDPPPEVTVHRGGATASRIVLPVIPSTGSGSAARQES